MDGIATGDAAKDIEAMLAAVRAERRWFHDEARARSIPGMLIDAAACAVREKALGDALAAVKRERELRR